MKNPEVTFLCYHYIERDDDFSRIWGHSRELFTKHIKYLENAYSLVSIEEIRRYNEGESHLPEMCATVTFDDSLAEHARIIAPYLNERNIKGMFNISPAVFHGDPLSPQVIHFGTAYYGIRKFSNIVRNHYESGRYGSVDNLSFIDEEGDIHELHKKIKRFLKYDVKIPDERKILLDIWHTEMARDIPDLHEKVYMTKDELISLYRAGHEIGLHTNTHALINDETFTDELFKTEIEDAKQELESIINAPVRVFSYPYAYKEDVLYQDERIARIRDLGIDMIFTIFKKEGYKAFDPNFIGRYSSYSKDSIEDLQDKLWSYEISNSHKQPPASPVFCKHTHRAI